VSTNLMLATRGSFSKNCLHLSELLLWSLFLDDIQWQHWCGEGLTKLEGLLRVLALPASVG